MSARLRPNLFSLLLIPAGLLFAVTAVAYGYMAFAVVNAPADAAKNAAHPLFVWLRIHGNAALFGELIVLAFLTVCVIAADSRTPPAREPIKPGRNPDEPRRFSSEP